MMLSMRRSVTQGILTLLLIVSPAIVWLIWAENEYGGMDYCPWDSGRGNPLLVGLVLIVPSAGLMAWRVSKRGPSMAVCSGLAVGLLAGLIIAVVAVFFGAGLRCTD
jgi:hypothetical protein